MNVSVPLVTPFNFMKRLAKQLHFVRNYGIDTLPRNVPRSSLVFSNNYLSSAVAMQVKQIRIGVNYNSRFNQGVIQSQFRHGIHTSAVFLHGEYEWQDPKSEEEIVKVHFVEKDGKLVTIRGKVGDNLLYLAKRFEVEMEGACEASLACTTCHVYVDHDFLDLLPEATETEEDLLDQAPFLKENSRLGCQIILSKELEGIKLKIPAATKNFYVDGHKPTPH